MSHINTARSVEFCSSYGTHLLYHLAADAACLTGSQVAVVAIGQVDADVLSDKHLKRSIAAEKRGMLIRPKFELLISILSFGFLRKKLLSEESIFFP